MKKHQVASNCSFLLAALVGMTTVRTSDAATNPPPPLSGVTRADSAFIKGVEIYSMKFPGGRISTFFSFLQTNGFGDDNVLIAGRAGDVYVPEFAVHKVQLKEVAKTIEFVTEERVKVEVVERGEAGDVNIWRIKLSDLQSDSKVRACPVPRLLASWPSLPKGRDRIDAVVNAVTGGLKEAGAEGKVRVLESEKIAVAIGSTAYVEGVARALEAAEQAAAIAPGPVGGEGGPKPAEK